MANLPGDLEYVNDIEVGGDNPVTQALIEKMGGSINALVALAQGHQEFLANGNFTVPENVTRVFVFACGGGGGGAGAAAAGTLGLGGGCGAMPVLIPVKVTPGAIHAVTIGAGGNGGTAASGADGTATAFGSLLSFAGASKGFNASVSQPPTTWRGNGPFIAGGFNAVGEDSVFAVGGALGVAGTATQKGGGGGAGLGAGGAGGSHATNGTAAAANSGAGGGASGAGGGVNRSGGAGGSGYLLVIW